MKKWHLWGAAAWLALAACGSREPKNLTEISPEISGGGGGGQKFQIVEGAPCTDWKYNEDKHEITMPDSCVATGLVLVFQQHLTEYNAETNTYTAKHPLGRLSNDALYRQELLVNGRRFSGQIFGILQGDKSAQPIFSGYFQEGEPCSELWAMDAKGNRADYKGAMLTMCAFNRPSGVRKPILYLYPETTQLVQVQVQPRYPLTHTYPKYPAQGWRVWAQPNGDLTDVSTQKTHYALFWEGEDPQPYALREGFVVKGSESAEFLEAKLAQLGLSAREANEFIVYWLPELEKNPYNLVHFSTDEYQRRSPLRIQPAPQTLIRVFMVYQPLEKPIEIAAQQLPQTPVRQGFTVVEWGGLRQDARPSL